MAMNRGTSPDAGTWYRVALNTIVRKGVKLDSERLRILPMGSRVCVVEQVDRRVRITQPVHGWCSIKSSNGDVILTKLEKTDQGPPPATPKIRAERNKRAEELEALLKDNENLRREIQRAEEGHANQLKSKLEQMRGTQELTEEQINKATGILEQMADLNAQLEIKQRKMKQNQAVLNQMSATSLGASEVEPNEAKLSYRENDVVSLKASVGGGFGIVKWFGDMEGKEVLGVQFSGPMNTKDPQFTGQPHFECDPGCGAYITLKHVKRYITSEELLQKLNTQVARLLKMNSSKE